MDNGIRIFMLVAGIKASLLGIKEKNFQKRQNKNFQKKEKGKLMKKDTEKKKQRK